MLSPENEHVNVFFYKYFPVSNHLSALTYSCGPFNFEVLSKISNSRCKCLSVYAEITIAFKCGGICNKDKNENLMIFLNCNLKFNFHIPLF